METLKPTLTVSELTYLKDMCELNSMACEADNDFNESAIWTGIKDTLQHVLDRHEPAITITITILQEHTSMSTHPKDRTVVDINMDHIKSTPATYVYAQPDAAVPTVYVKKSAFDGTPPKTIRLTISIED